MTDHIFLKNEKEQYTAHCAGCIFSKDHELGIEMRENPHIYEELDRLEVESGFTMSMSGKRIRDRIK